MEKPKDRDLVETTEGLIFCLVGYLHPPERYTAYLKYAPDPGGKWSRGDTRYSRTLPYYSVTAVENTYALLKERYPRYIYFDPVMNIEVSSVPRSLVKTYYGARERLEALFREGPQDALVEKLLNLVDWLISQTGLKRNDFGVTGSILSGTHSVAFSDIDLTINGLRASRLVRDTVRRNRDVDGVIRPFSEAQLDEWCRSRVGRFPLSYDDLRAIAERRWDYCYYKGTYVSLHPIRATDEIREVYGDNIYHSKGKLRGRATIVECEESLFLPAIYGVDDVIGPENVTILTSFEGMFTDVFREGEAVEFSGTLEEVTGEENYHRIVVGASGSDDSFLRLVG